MKKTELLAKRALHQLSRNIVPAAYSYVAAAGYPLKLSLVMCFLDEITVLAVVNFGGNCWELSSQTYFGVGTQFSFIRDY